MGGRQIFATTMCMLLGIIVFFRVIADRVVDFFLSFYWERQKVVIPDLDRKHSFLAESALSLARMVKKQQLTSQELVQATISRMKKVNPHLNAIAADRFEAALEEAQKIDDAIATGLSDELADKPFLGVPFTTKESQAICGMPLTMGLWCRQGEIAKEDSEAVIRLRAAGAIPIASTNLPELLVWQETRNPVYGMANNPHHTGRTTGGSSGGEAALSATYATAISLCSDLGGSTRMPAFYCGLFGHHPTAGTIDTKGSFFRNGNEDSMYSLGFMSKHVEDLAPLTKVIAGNKASLLKLDRQIDIKNIRFHYFECTRESYVSPISGELKGVMYRVMKHLNEELNIPVQPYHHEGLNYIYYLWRYWMLKEPGDLPTMLTNNNGMVNGIWELIKKVFCLSKLCFFSIMRVLELQILPLPQADWSEDMTKNLKEDLFDKLGDNGVLLVPSAPQVAPYHYALVTRPWNFAYWALANLLKCPATQVPIGKNSQNLPMGIQILAAPYNDALCLTVAKYLEEHFGGAIPACKLAWAGTIAEVSSDHGKGKGSDIGTVPYRSLR